MTALVTIIFASLVSISLPCSENQYKVVSVNGSVTCYDCPKCPAGYGPLQQCGTIIPKDKLRIKCQPCVAKFNFSSEDDYEQCSACGTCSMDQEMTPCTGEINTVCHHRCISKENYFEESSDDCQKCWGCCGDSRDIVKDECIKKGRPEQQSCSIHRKNECPAPIITDPPTEKTTDEYTTVSKTSRKSSTESPVISTTTTSKPSIATPVDRGSKKNRNNEPNDWLKSAVIIFSILSCFVIIVAVYKCVIKIRNNRQDYQRWLLPCVRYQNQKQFELCEIEDNLPVDPNANDPVPQHDADNEEEEHVTSQGEPLIVVNIPDSQIYTGAGVRLFEWFERHYNKKEQICGMLDAQQSFVKVANYFKMEGWKVEKLKALPGNNPTATVMDYVLGQQPNLLVSQFMLCTDFINRKDVSEVLKDAH